jgi:hypothetical protein
MKRGRLEARCCCGPARVCTSERVCYCSRYNKQSLLCGLLSGVEAVEDVHPAVAVELEDKPMSNRVWDVGNSYHRRWVCAAEQLLEC